MARGKGHFAVEAHQRRSAGQNIQRALNQGRGGTYHNRGNLMRRGAIKGRGYAPA